MMPSPLQRNADLLANLSRRHWLMGVDQHQVLDLADQRLAELADRPTVLLAEAEPAEFLAGFLAATAARCPLVLGNPDWRSEWQQVLTHVRPDRVWGKVTLPEAPTPAEASAEVPAGQPLSPGWILIPTGGSSGQIRFAIHSWETLQAAVLGFQAHFEVGPINSWCLLPLYHVSGLMQVMRALLTDGNLMLWPFVKSALSCPPLLSPSRCRPSNSSDWPSDWPSDWFLSLVPTQLQRLLLYPEGQAWLREFHTVFVGGGPTWNSLLTEARRHRIRLAPTYGMTETAAQIATLNPDAFLRGESSCGTVLPHAQVEILPLPHQPNPDAPQLSPEAGPEIGPEAGPEVGPQIGQIRICASSLMLGYFPPSPHPPIPPSPHLTDDLGYLDPQGHLHIVGRSSRKIITGGENVFPAEVEAVIRETGLTREVWVVGLPDPVWGEKVVAVCALANPDRSDAEIQTALQTQVEPRLSRYKQPKQWVWVEQIPRNAVGKIDLVQLRQFLASGQTHIRPRPPAESSADAAPERPPNWR